MIQTIFIVCLCVCDMQMSKAMVMHNDAEISSWEYTFLFITIGFCFIFQNSSTLRVKRYIIECFFSMTFSIDKMLTENMCSMRIHRIVWKSN